MQQHDENQTPQMIEPMEQPPAAMLAPAKLGPVGEGERIAVLDVLRGFALFGVLIVNMQFFSLPFMQAFYDPSMAVAPVPEQLSWGFVKVFFEYKFISLFSLLFGIGLAVQLVRADRAGRPFVPVYLRRLGLLAIIGASHALLLWYGDILLMYAGIGLVLLFFCRKRAKTLLMLAAIWFIVGLVLVTGLTALQVAVMKSYEAQQAWAAQVEDAPAEALEDIADDSAVDVAEEEAVAEAAEESAEEDVVEHAPLRGFEAIKKAQWDPNNAVWVEAETAAYKEGPLRDAVIFRANTYSMGLIFGFFGFFWHIAAMFFLGAALLKFDFFAPHNRAWHARFAAVGLFVGLPIEFLSTWLQHAAAHEFGWHTVLVTFLHEFGSVALMLGYVGAITLIVGSGILQPITSAIACVGRMSLTVYLSETVLVTGIMYWWGLGMFNEVSRAEMIGIALAVYGVLLLFSVAWMSAFKLGPMEWVWRSATYAKLQPIRRSS